MRTTGVCVYGGSSNHVDPVYLQAAYALGEGIARRGWMLINGAGDTGMMGAATRGCLAQNGKTMGIAPDFFAQPGILFNEGIETIFTRTMRERKAFMESLSAAFIASPGGIGTLEEFYEILTLKQLRQLDSPLILLNMNHYYDALLEAMRSMEKAGFIHSSIFDLFTITTTVKETFDVLDAALAEKK